MQNHSIHEEPPHTAAVENSNQNHHSCCNKSVVVSLNSTMLEGAKLMREQDAELLESMRFTDSCSSGATPTLRPSTPSTSIMNEIPPLPDMIPDSTISSVPTSSSLRKTSSMTIRRDSSVMTLPRRFDGTTTTNNTISSSNSQIEESSFLDAVAPNDDRPLVFLSGDSNLANPNNDLLLPSVTAMPLELESSEGLLYRQCLSGDVRLANEDVLIHMDAGNTSLASVTTVVHYVGDSIGDEAATTASPISVTQDVVTPPPPPQQQQQQDQQQQQRQASESSGGEGRIFRTKSMDRRMSEAFQFAEAVGEQMLPPAIIEEADDDDDDDDANAKEIRLDETVTTVTSCAATTAAAANRPGPTITANNQRTLTGRGTATDPSCKHSSGRSIGKTRPQWPFPSTSGHSTFLFQLPDGVSTPDFAYKGICANPPEITTHGISRGNYAQLHRKAWLEVSDKYHRYGKNLRLYYRSWENLGFPTNSFFDWLDSKGEAAGQSLPNFDECPRSQLDSDTVLYITNPDITQGYALSVIPDGQGRGLVLDVDGEKVRTGNEGWIFVLRDNVMYGALKITSISGHSKQRFHHSSFFGGKAVQAAGIFFTNDDGFLIRLYPHSGHYRPGEAHIQRMLFYLHHKGVDLRTFEMDTQQILHVARDGDTGNVIAPTTTSTTTTTTTILSSDNQNGESDGAKIISEKKKKIQSLHLKTAVYVACFLAHKARFIGAGIFTAIHKIRKADVTTVSEALDAVDDGGYWKKISAIRGAM